MPRIPNPTPHLRRLAKAGTSLGRSAGTFPGRLGIASTTLIGAFVAFAFGLICYLGAQGWPSALGVGVGGGQVLEVDADRPPAAGRSPTGPAGPAAAADAVRRTAPVGQAAEAEPQPTGGGGGEGAAPVGAGPSIPDAGEPDDVPVAAPPAGPGGDGQTAPADAPAGPPASNPKPPAPAASPGGGEDPGGLKPDKPPMPTNPPPSPKPTKPSTAPKPPQSAKPTKPAK